jgi:hypothetical protein
MSDFNIVNLNGFTWMLNVAIMGAVFSVFSLIYNPYFIYYGFTTFAYGVFTHVVFKIFEWKAKENNIYDWLSTIVNTVLTIIWLIILIVIY